MTTKTRPISLFDFVLTHEDFVLFNQQLDQVIEHVFDTKTTPESVLSEYLSHEKKQAVIAFAEEEKLPFAQPNQMQTVLDRIKERLAEIPIVEMKVAFEPSERLLNQITNWLNDSNNQRVFVKFVVDRSLIAGAVISFNGNIHDYSVKTQIEQLLSAQQ